MPPYPSTLRIHVDLCLGTYPEGYRVSCTAYAILYMYQHIAPAANAHKMSHSRLVLPVLQARYCVQWSCQCYITAIADADQLTHLCVQHVVEFGAKLIEESCRVLTTVVNDLSHLHILKYGFQLLQEIRTNFKHVKQVAFVVDKDLQAAARLQHHLCGP